MKKSLLTLGLALVVLTSSYAQRRQRTEEELKPLVKAKDTATYNAWSFEVALGQSKGIRPYTPGYFSSNPNAELGSVRANSFTIGVRYMMSPKFGFKFDLASDRFKNNTTESLPFDVQQYRLGVQGVINASRLFGVEQKFNRFGLLLHGGFSYARMMPKYNKYSDDITQNDVLVDNNNQVENNFGLIFGLTPEVRISKKLGLQLDLSMISNFRQHFAWDGHYSETQNNLAGQMLNASLGITYGLGKFADHGDYAVMPNKQLEEIAALAKRIDEMETLMNDTDKDGVPDYLDAENNSIAGVAVDTKGRMVDLNGNGIPDEMEGALARTFADKSSVAKAIDAAGNSSMVAKFINEGYVATFFDTNKTKPTNVSTEGIDFILTYMRNNPTASVDIIGHADEIGDSERNKKLADQRANSVKGVLIKGGISADRLNVIAAGEDTSVDPTSSEARSLVRRVTFKVK
ncbi:MAG: OmpA family protein [Flavobacterium sp.]|nr:OmpA family protein [Flavobacterium sp.]